MKEKTSIELNLIEYFFQFVRYQKVYKSLNLIHIMFYDWGYRIYDSNLMIYRKD
jgi:hypothetical protein